MALISRATVRSWKTYPKDLPIDWHNKEFRRLRTKEIDTNKLSKDTGDVWYDGDRLFERARYLMQQEDNEEAALCFDRLVTFNPLELYYIIYAVNCHVSSTNDEKIRKEGSIYCDFGIKCCIDYCRKGVAVQMGYLINLFWMKAQMLFQNKKFKEVILFMNEALKYNENKDISYNWRASAYCELKLINEAIGDFTKAIEECKDETSSTYYNSRGTCYNELKKYRKALEDYNMALKKDKENVSAWNNRSSLYVELGKYKQVWFYILFFALYFVFLFLLFGMQSSGVFLLIICFFEWYVWKLLFDLVWNWFFFLICFWIHLLFCCVCWIFDVCARVYV